MGQVRHDGLYAAPGDGYTTYLRFYPGGEVISESSTGTAEEVARWISRKGAKPTRYAVNGGEIEFVFHIWRAGDRGEDPVVGDISYRGRVAGERLNLHVTSELTGLDKDDVFTFVAAAFGEAA